jgi:hypothetical protein
MPLNTNAGQLGPAFINPASFAKAIANKKVTHHQVKNWHLSARPKISTTNNHYEWSKHQSR